MPRPLAGKRCLVVDDEFLIALDLQEMLEQAGAAEVVCAGHVGDALEAVRAGRFDLAVLDLHLGRSGGTSLPVAEVLSAAGTPFVFLTGMRADAVQTHGYPAAPVVEKPYEAANLMAAIQRLVRS